MRDVLFLLLGLALLWTPRGWLRLGKAEGSGRRKPGKAHGGPNRDRLPGDNSLWAGEEFARRRNWVDLGRGLAGATAVMVTVPVLVAAWINVSGVPVAQIVFGAQAGILIAAVLIQMVRVEERLTLFPPIFFICGLAFAVVGWKAALIGFIAIWAINIVLPNPATFLAAYAGGIVILAVFFGREVTLAVLMAALAGLPPILAVLFRRRLAQFRKRTKVIVR